MKYRDEYYNYVITINLQSSQVPAVYIRCRLVGGKYRFILFTANILPRHEYGPRCRDGIKPPTVMVTHSYPNLSCYFHIFRPNGKAEIKIDVPESTNPYVISGFVIHPEEGLTLVQGPIMVGGLRLLLGLLTGVCGGGGGGGGRRMSNLRNTKCRVPYFASHISIASMSS